MHTVNVDGTENVLGLAHELGVPRTIYVSTVQAFGRTGPQPQDETFTRQGPIRTTYEQSKTDAHEIARQYQQRGLPLIIVCPHQVIGVNDHSPLGYFMRLYINRVMPPMAWSPNSIFCCVNCMTWQKALPWPPRRAESARRIFYVVPPNLSATSSTVGARNPARSSPEFGCQPDSRLHFLLHWNHYSACWVCPLSFRAKPFEFPQ